MSGIGRCYYDILGVDMGVSSDELVQAYRRLALLWHPDKNMHQVELASEKFKEIGSAYEILSDPKDRAWYDAHRESILRGGTGSDSDTVESEDYFWKYFRSDCFGGFDDGEGGFYRVYGDLFELIAAAESKCRGANGKAPKFGKSESDYLKEVNPFYTYWAHFSTSRSFACNDIYNTTTAPNRQVRRIMEKENAMARRAAKKSYDKVVIQLVRFVCKKDPRVCAWTQAKAKEVSSIGLDREQPVDRGQLERRKQLAKQLRESHSESIDLSSIEDFSLLMSEKDLKRYRQQFGKEAADEGAADELVVYYSCPVCDRDFKSAKQLENHERSKRHRDLVDCLRSEASRAAQGELELDIDALDISVSDPSNQGAREQAEVDDCLHLKQDDLFLTGSKFSDFGEKRMPSPGVGYELHDVVDTLNSVIVTDEVEVDDDCLSRMAAFRSRHSGCADKEDMRVVDSTDLNLVDDDVLRHISECAERRHASSGEQTSFLSESERDVFSKPTKPKRRRACKVKRGAEMRDALASSSSLSPATQKAAKCRICQEEFPSKTSLHAHLQATGHAVAV